MPARRPSQQLRVNRRYVRQHIAANRRMRTLPEYAKILGAENSGIEERLGAGISQTEKMSPGAMACCVIALLIAGILAGRNLASWPTRINYPGEESYEGCAMVEMALLGQGVHIYAPPSPQGFVGATYGPLYFILGSHLIDPYHPTYFPLRLISAMAIFGCALGCGLLSFWLTRSYLAATLSPLAFLSYGVVTFHGVSALSDNVALFLFFAGFLIAWRFRDSAALLLSAPVMVLGFYYKPQFIAGPLAVFAFLILEKRYRLAAQFTAALAACGFGMLALFQFVMFPGQQFWRHFFLYQATLFSWDQFKVGLLVFLLMLAAPLFLAFEFLRHHSNRLLACYLAFAVALGIVTIGKESAFIQYFYESFLLVSALVPALLIARLKQRTAPYDVVFLLAFALVAGQWYTPHAPSPAAFQENAALQTFLQQNFPPRTRALGFRGGDLIQAGFDTPFSDLFQTELLARRGVVPDREMVGQIRARWFSVIVLDFDLQTEKDPYWLNFYLNEDARRAIAENYELAGTAPTPSPEKLWPGDQFYLYVPRKAATTDATPAN